MLTVPNPDDLDYKKIFEQARARIPALTDQWTDYNDHDPGITVLQTFAWLADMQNFYLAATGEAHRLAYLKLLGILPNQAPARCTVAFAADGERLKLLAGTRMAAGETLFELETGYVGRPNRLVRLYSECAGLRRDMTGFVGPDEDSAPVFLPENGAESTVWFGFARPFENGAEFFIQVPQDGRNPFEGDFSLTRLGWEWFDGTNWQQAACLSDETGGLLRSGTVRLNFSGTAAEFSKEGMVKACYLRCRLLSGEYDVSPRIMRVLPNCAAAVQRHTWAAARVHAAPADDTLELEHYLRPGDRVTVAVGSGEEFETWFDSEEGPEDCRLEAGAEPGEAFVRFFARRPAPNDRVLVLIREEAVMSELILGETDGCASQRFALNMDHLCGLQLALVRRDAAGNSFYTLWRQTDDLLGAGYDDKVFGLDRETGEAVFGDGIHGCQPEAGCTVAAVTVQTSAFEDGNVLAGRVCRFADPLPVSVTVENPQPAAGGHGWPDFAKLEERIAQKLDQTARAVTAEDTRALVMATPGLRIDSVAVIPMKQWAAAYGQPTAPNTVVVAVKPAASVRRPQLSEVYRRLIAQNLERYRLLTTDIRVVSAQYVGISVYGRVALCQGADRADVVRLLEERLDGITPGAFGRKADYGRLFAALEMMEQVQSVQQLSLEYVGAGGSKNEQGDILVAPDSLSYLREVSIEFI